MAKLKKKELSEQERIEKDATLSAVTRENITDSRRQEMYQQYVEYITPKANLPLRMIKAFLVGGIICCIGQWIMNYSMHLGASQDDASGYTSMILILISIILTGCNIYPTIANFGGAGALVPITGFANSVAAPAIEFKKDECVIIGIKVRKP